ncbi:MAG: ThiF family adenylyltransferase [Cellulomonas sp.]|jgi:adenylyltransferase/sulfurtransferase|nr:ThiF family adenylyltransferase [Cellulomonas sp.]
MPATSERHGRPSRGRPDPAPAAAERGADRTASLVPDSLVPDDRLRPLTAAETVRYARHLLLPQVGDEGQRRIRAAKVLVVGLGGLGSPVALYLAAAGVGTIGLADFDVVEESNLQRQVIHSTSDTGRAKVDSAADRLVALNPAVRFVRHPTGLTAGTPPPDDPATVVAGYDVVVDCTDSFGARYLLNEVCLAGGTPLVHGSVWQFHGQVTVLATTSGPCYRCLYPEPPAPGQLPDPSRVGILGVLPGIVGTVQATEVLKLVVGGPVLVGRVLQVDSWSMRFDEVRLAKDPACPACGPLL